jgi:hypothetical protein
MMRLATGAHDLRILDRDHGLPITDESVAHACQATAERRELHVLLLQRPIREKLGHAVSRVGLAREHRDHVAVSQRRAAALAEASPTGSATELARRLPRVHGFPPQEGGSHG